MGSDADFGEYMLKGMARGRGVVGASGVSRILTRGAGECMIRDRLALEKREGGPHICDDGLGKFKNEM